MGVPPGEQSPPPGSGWGAAPPVRPRKSSRTCLVVALVLGGLVVLAGIAFVALFGAVEDPGRDGPDGPAGDVKITACAVDAATKWPRADLDVTNRSSKASDYVISVEFVSPSGERLTEAHTSLTHLAPGQVAHDRAGSLVQVNAPVTCRITDVVRSAS